MSESIVIRVVVEPSGRMNVTGNCPLPVMVGTLEMAKHSLVAGAMTTPPTMLNGELHDGTPAPSAAVRVPGFSPKQVA